MASDRTSARLIRRARRDAGLTQAALAARAGTSQATLSDYERGRKVPSAETLARIVAAAGRRLELATAERPVRTPARVDHERAARALSDVLALAAALPSTHRRTLGYPRLPRAAERR